MKVGRLALAWALLTGCEGPAMFSDLARSIVPQPEDGYQAQGRFLHEGEFHALRLEMAPPSYDFALALDSSGDLLVHSIGTGESCWVRDVERYQPAIWRSLDFEAAQIPFVRLVDGDPTLFFADFDCQVAEVSVPGGRVVDYLPLPDDAGILVEAADGRVVAVNPWSESSRELGSRVLGDEHPFRYSLLVKDGKLVLYDVDAEPITAVGNEVVDAGVLANASELLVLEADGGLAAVSVLGTSGDVKWLADDACELFDQGPVSDVIAYYSPCGARRLVLYRPAIRGEPAATFRFGIDAEHPRIVTRSLELERHIEAEALSVVFFRQRDEAEERGELWAQSAEKPPYRLAGDIYDSWLLPAYDRYDSEHAVVAFALAVNDDRLDLVALDGEQRNAVARGVTGIYENRQSLALLLENRAGSTDLVLLESKPFADVVFREPELLLSNALAGLTLEKTVVLEGLEDEASTRQDEGGDELSLFRTDAERGHRLYLLRQSHLDGSFAEPLPLLDGVGERYSFSMHVPESVLALGDPEHGGRLRQVWYSRGLESTIAERVTSYFETSFAERGGLLFATAGDRAGLYYTGLR